MSLFGKKQPEPAPEISYDDVVEYLRDLAQTDYIKIQKVVNIYRNADKDVKKVLNIKEVPMDLNHLKANSILDDDDTELGNFFDDDHDSPASSKQTKTAKKAVKGKKK